MKSYLQYLLLINQNNFFKNNFLWDFYSNLIKKFFCSYFYHNNNENYRDNFPYYFDND